MHILRPKKSNVNFGYFDYFFNFAGKYEIIDARLQIRFKYIVNIPIFDFGQQIMCWGLFLSRNHNFFLGPT